MGEESSASKRNTSTFQVSENQWFRMKPEQQQAHLRKVATASVSTSTSGDLTHTGGDSLQTNDVSPLSLSLDVSSVSEGITVPLPCLLYT